MSRENPVDLMNEADSILRFLAEVLSALACPGRSADGLSRDGVEGLALICIHLQQLCLEAGKEDGFRLAPE